MPVFFTGFWVSPSPPTHDVGNKKEYLQKHVRIELHLEEQKKRKSNVDQAQGPAPDIGHGRKYYGRYAAYPSKEFKIAYGVSKYAEKDMIDVEELQNESLKFNAHIFCFCKKAQCLPSSLAANTRLFHAPKGCAQVAQEPAVYPDDAAFDLMRYAMCAF